MSQKRKNMFIPEEWLFAAEQSTQQHRNHHPRMQPARSLPQFDVFQRYPPNFNFHPNSIAQPHQPRNKQIKHYNHNNNLNRHSEHSQTFRQYENPSFWRHQQQEEYLRRSMSSSHNHTPTSSRHHHRGTRHFTSSAPESSTHKRTKIQRKWTNINKMHKHDFGFTAVSYNILSQKLLELNSHLYRNADPHVLEWNYRWGKLQHEIEKFDAEIFCFQEIENCHYEADIKPFLEDLGYSCHYKKRTSNNANKPDGVLTAFKLKKFNLVSQKDVEYNREGLPDGWKNQENVGLIMALQSQKNPECKLVVANTHLLYNPKRGDMKLLQAAILMTEIHATLNELSASIATPVLMCGDFNSTPTSNMDKFITTGSLYYKDLNCRDISGQKTNRGDKKLYNPFIPKNINITHNCTRNENDTPYENDDCTLRHSVDELESCHKIENRLASTMQDDGIVVDHVYYSKTQSENSNTTRKPQKYNIKLIGTLNLVEGEVIRDSGGLPNTTHPSDHLPIVCKFVLTKI